MEHPDVARLLWPIRRSFTAYVQNMGGRVTMLDGTSHVDDTFVFPGMRVSPQRWEFTGAVVFQAHRGMLEVRLAAPTVHLDDDGAHVSVATRPDGSGRVVVVIAGDLRSGFAGVRLTDDGAALFGGAYPPGEAMDPFRIDGGG